MFYKKEYAEARLIIEKLNGRNDELREENEKLKQELAGAKDLHKILETLVGKVEENSSNYLGLCTEGSNIIFGDTGGLVLSDDIPQYVDDYFGGKVIKQEGVKVVVLNKDGEIKESGFTRQKEPDKGYSYLLIREI